jgi:hypothetical protein
MGNLLAESLKSERYFGCPITTLRPSALVELGRAMAHHGLLVERVREFVTYVASEVGTLPTSIGSKEAIKLFPFVITSIQPAFSANERRFLGTALKSVSKAEEALDRFRYSSWGVSNGNDKKFSRSEHRKYKGLGCRSDQTDYTVNSLHKLAMEISLAIKHICKVEGILSNRISEESHSLRKKIDRRLARKVR